MFYKYDIKIYNVGGEVRYLVRRRSWCGFGPNRYWDGEICAWVRFDCMFFQKRLSVNFENRFDKEASLRVFNEVSGVNDILRKQKAMALKPIEDSMQDYGG